MRFRHVIFGAALFWLALATAIAQVPMGGGPLGQFPPGAFSNKAASDPAAGAASPTWTNISTAIKTGCGFVTTCSITGVTVATGFTVVVIAGNDNGATGTISAVTACGTGLTSAVAPASSANGVRVAIYYGSVTGGSCQIDVTASNANNWDFFGVGVGLLANLSSSTPGTACSGKYVFTQAAPYPCTAGITVSAGGYGIQVFATTVSETLTSSNTTIDSQSAVTGFTIAIAHTTSSNTPEFTAGGFENVALASAPWR